MECGDSILGTGWENVIYPLPLHMIQIHLEQEVCHAVKSIAPAQRKLPPGQAKPQRPKCNFLIIGCKSQIGRPQQRPVAVWLKRSPVCRASNSLYRIEITKGDVFHFHFSPAAEIGAHLLPGEAASDEMSFCKHRAAQLSQRRWQAPRHPMEFQFRESEPARNPRRGLLEINLRRPHSLPARRLERRFRYTRLTA